MTPERQKQVLAAVLVVLVGVVLVRTVPSLMSGGGSSGPTGAFASAGRRGPVAQVDGSGAEFVTLRLDELEQKPGEFEPGRDPFRFQPKRTAAPKKPPPPPRKPPVRRTRRTPPPRPAQPATPRPPEPTFRFLGSFGSEERRVAVFSDSTEIFNVLEGGVLKDAFVVRKIGFESADVGWVNFPDEPARRLAAGG